MESSSSINSIDDSYVRTLVHSELQEWSLLKKYTVIPDEIRVQIFQCIASPTCYQIQDDGYRYLIVSIINKLDPYREKFNDIILKTLEEEKGKFDAGREAIRLIQSGELKFQDLGEWQSDDSEICDVAVKIEGLSICKFAGKQYILELMRKNAFGEDGSSNVIMMKDIIPLVNPEFFNDRVFVLSLVEFTHLALKYAPELQKDRKFVLAAVGINGLALKYAPAFQNDKEVVITAVRQNGMALEFAPELNDDFDIVVEAMRASVGLALDYVSPNFQMNEEILNYTVIGYSQGNIRTIVNNIIRSRFEDGSGQ